VGDIEAEVEHDASGRPVRLRLPAFTFKGHQVGAQTLELQRGSPAGRTTSMTSARDVLFETAKKTAAEKSITFEAALDDIKQSDPGLYRMGTSDYYNINDAVRAKQQEFMAKMHSYVNGGISWRPAYLKAAEDRALWTAAWSPTPNPNDNEPPSITQKYPGQVTMMSPQEDAAASREFIAEARTIQARDSCSFETALERVRVDNPTLFRRATAHLR
jgi:hypothetical protein